MQPFLILKNTDLIFDLQNDCIIHTNLLGCATTKRRGKTRPCLQSPCSQTNTTHGYNKALPVSFTVNCQEEMTREPIEGNSQHFPNQMYSRPALSTNAFFVMNLHIPP